jgi:hypothetical protein
MRTFSGHPFGGRIRLIAARGAWMLAAVGGGGLVACEPAGAATNPRVRLDFSEVSASPGTPATSFTNRGGASVRARAVVAGGGAVRASTGRGGGSERAVRFPSFDPWAPAPSAAISIVNATTTDQLDPDRARFEFGADFTLAATSANLSSSSVDDGDNLVQRGLYEERTQWKLEIDRRRPSCRIKGRSGTVTVTAGMEVAADRWYRARCIRDGDRVTVAVTSWSSSGAASTRTWSRTGPTGDMTPDRPSVPMSVGGKLRNGAMDGDPDQFTGRADNVVLVIG